MASIFKRLFLNDLLLKAASVILAVCFWFYLAVVLDPETQTTIRNVPINYTNKDTVTSNGLVMVETSEEILADVTIKGSRKLISITQPRDLRLVVDLSQCTQAEVYDLKIEPSFRPSTTAMSIVELSPISVSVEMDELAEKSVPIEVRTKGQLRDDYLFGEKTVSATSLTVKGPKKDIDTIDAAIVEIDLMNVGTDIREKLPVHLVNASGAVVEDAEADISIDTVDVYYQVLKRKKVPIEVLMTIHVGKDVVIPDSAPVPDPVDPDAEGESSSPPIPTATYVAPIEREFTYEPTIVGFTEVSIVGPEALIDSIDTIYTKLIDPLPYSDGMTQNEPLDIPEGVKTEPDTTEVSIRMKYVYKNAQTKS